MTDVVVPRVIKNNRYGVRTIIRVSDEKALKQARRERANLKRRIRRAKNPEKFNAAWREWRKKNVSKVVARQRLWRQENKERLRAYNSRYYELNPHIKEYRAQKNREYRARKKLVRQLEVSP